MINPLLLWFLPLVLVPVLMHLITLYRLRTVELSTFRFLMESYVQQRRRVKLLEYLLMILRTLFVLLIILTLARPVIDQFAGLFGSETGRDVMIVVDASSSMALNTDGTSSLDRAKSTGRTIMGMLGETDYVTILRAGHQPEQVASGFASKTESMVGKLEEIEPDLTAADLPAALGEALGAVRHGPRIVYMLTDGQRRSWSQLADHPVLKKVEDNTQLVVMNVGSSEPVGNLAVVGDPPRSLRPVVGLPTLLTATIGASDDAEPTDTRLSVMIDDEQVTQIPVSLQPGERITRPITIVPKRAGVLRGRFELPDDKFPDDDQYLFSLNVQEHINVLLLTGDTNRKGAESPALFIRSALRAPLLARGAVDAEEQRIAESLKVNALDERQLNEKHLAVADVVIAADLKLDKRRAQMLREYVREGGGLLMMTGPRFDVKDANRYLLRDEKVDDEQTPDIWYEEPTGDPEDEATFVPVSDIDYNHPVLSAFDDDDEQTEFFGTARLYRYLPISITRDNIRTLMRLPDRRAALAELQHGDGRMMLAGFAATPEFSNLPLKPEFVPLLLRSVAHLRRDEPVQAVQAVRPYEPAPIRLAGAWAEASVQVTSPDGKLDTIDMHRNDRVMIGAMKDSNRKGYYTFTVQPPAEGPGDLTTQRRGFTVNLDVDDAGFEPIDEDQLRQIFAPHELTYLAGSPDDPVLAEQLTQRHEIWRTLIWIMFAIIAAEFLLSTLKPAGGRPGGISGSIRRVAEKLGAKPNTPTPLSQRARHEPAKPTKPKRPMERI